MIPDSSLVRSFVEAKHWVKGVVRASPRLIVIHSAESSESPRSAENIAHWFATMPDRQIASAHYCIDSDSIVQCVPERGIAYHARGGDINLCAIGIELAGRASQTREQWLDDYGQRMLALCRALLADISERRGVPLVLVSDEQLRSHTARGIATHAQITRAFRVRGGHTDPGLYFPIDLLAT